MSLIFGAVTSDRVEIAGAASINDLHPYTIAMWVYPTTLTNTRILFTKGATNARHYRFNIIGSSGAVELLADRTTDTVYDSSTSVLSLNTWCFIAVTYNTGNSANDLARFYYGRLNAAVVKDTPATTTDGSGALKTESGAVLVIGNNATATNAFQGRIATAQLWNRELTLGELADQQFHPHITSGCVLLTHLGFNGTGTQVDWSGNGNSGTVTGATVDTHVPIGPPFGYAFNRPIFIPSALRTTKNMRTPSLHMTDLGVGRGMYRR